MAVPMTASQILAQLKKWDLKYKELTVGGVSWKNHNRAGHGTWGGSNGKQMNGFIWHHTGADVGNGLVYAQGTLWNGITGLPGPLCHFSIGTDGTVYLVGWGRANHAGGGDPVVLNHVINEDYSGQLHPTKGNSNGTDGNTHFYGVEIQYSGSHKMTAAQYQAALKLSAAILDFHVTRDGWGKDAKSVIAHGEWSSDKWDPGYASGKIMNMVDVRKDIAATLKAGPEGVKPPTGGTTVTAPTKPQAYKDVWDTDAATPPEGHATEKNPYWHPMSILTGIYEMVERLEDKVAELEKKLGE